MITKEEKKKIIIITGATGSGKSSYAIKLAQEINGIIINADSMQIYKHIPIITAQPSYEDIHLINHYLYGFLELNDKTYSVGKYIKDLYETLLLVTKQNPEKTPIIVGGTMLYVDTIINGLNTIPDIKADIREDIRQKYQHSTTENIFTDLQKIDNEYSNIVDKNNRQRLLRGIEVKLSTGKSILDFWKEKKHNIFEKDYFFEKYIVSLERDMLYSRINSRVDAMLKAGLLEEMEKVKKIIIEKDIQQNQLPKAIGLNHLLDYLNSKITLNIAIDLMKKDSRHYAKRQMTWWRNYHFDKVIAK